MTLARPALALLIVALLLTGVAALRSGVPIDTALADLAPPALPAGDGAGASAQLAARVQAFTGDTLRFVLVASVDDAPNRAALTAATAALRRTIDTVPGVRLIDPAARFERLTTALQPYRFSLLAPELARRVDAGELDIVSDDAIASLYGPGIDARPLPLEDDPLNGFGAWLGELLASASQTPSNAPVETVDLVRVAGHELDDAELASSLDAARDAVLDAWPAVSVHRSGVLFFAREAAEASRADINRISIGSALGLLLLLLPVFRSFWPLVLPALSIVVGAATGAALVWLVYGSMHVLTLVFGASLIGIVIDYSVHGFAHTHSYDAGVARDGKPVGGTRTLDARLQRALLLGLLTSALGYAALGLSSVDALARVALFSVGGLIGAWLCVIALLPMLAGPRSALRVAPLDRPVAALVALGRLLARPLIRWPRVAVGCAVLALLMLAAIGRSDDDPRRLIDLSPALIADARAIAHLADATDVARRVRVTARDLDAAYAGLDAIEQALPPPIRTTSIADWLPSPAQQRANRRRSVALLTTDGPAAQVFDAVDEPDASAALARLRATLARDEAAPLGSGELLDALLQDQALALPPLLARDVDGVATLALVTRDADPAALATAVESANARLGDRAHVMLLDSVADTARELGRQRRSGLLLLGVALAAIALLLLLVYRRVRIVALVAVPAASILGTLLVLAVLGIPLTLFHSVGLFLVLGLGMDYTIFLSELERSAPRTTLAAILLSAATSLLSFGLLAASSIPVARFFGQTVLIGNTLNLVFTFVLLALLTDSRRTTGSAADAARIHS